jgi:hypothetical protein
MVYPKNDHIWYSHVLANINEMKKTLLLLSIITIFLSCNSQSKEDKVGNIDSNTAIADSIKTWLPEGDHVADIMNKYDPRATFLSEKMGIAISQNQEWYFEFMKTIPEGAKMPYHENLGLTKKEYSEMMNLFDDMEVFSSGQEKLNIKYSGDVLLFKSSDSTLQGLNYLSIDLKDNKVKFSVPNQGEMSLSYKKEVNIKSASNGYKSTWHGYKWVYESGIDNQDFNEVKNISDINDFIKFEFTLGIMDKDKRIYFNLKMQSMANGEVIASNELPLLINTTAQKLQNLENISLFENDIFQLKLINDDKINCSKNLVLLSIKKEEFENCSIGVEGGRIEKVNGKKGLFELTPFCDRYQELKITVKYLNDDGTKPVLGEIKLEINK